MRGQMRQRPIPARQGDLAGVQSRLQDMPKVSIAAGGVMLDPGPEAAPMERLEAQLWKILGARAKAVGTARFRRLARLTVRHWPTESLERIRKAGHWQGAERKKVGRILVARVRETYEAADGVTDAWPIILEGTVALLWVCLCDMHQRHEVFRLAAADLSRWVSRNGLE